MKRKLRMGMIGGGKGAFIGAIHRIAATMDGTASEAESLILTNSHNVLNRSAVIGTTFAGEIRTGGIERAVAGCAERLGSLHDHVAIDKRAEGESHGGDLSESLHDGCGLCKSWDRPKIYFWNGKGLIWQYCGGVWYSKDVLVLWLICVVCLCLFVFGNRKDTPKIDRRWTFYGSGSSGDREL